MVSLQIQSQPEANTSNLLLTIKGTSGRLDIIFKATIKCSFGLKKELTVQHLQIVLK